MASADTPLQARVTALEDAVFGPYRGTPQPGQMWARTVDPGHAWRVCSLHGEMVHLELYREPHGGTVWELADQYQDVPLHRWARLVAIEGLRLR